MSLILPRKSEIVNIEQYPQLLNFVTIYTFYTKISQFFCKGLFYICITRYNIYMDERTENNLTLIENKELLEKEETTVQPASGRVTNPIAKKLLEFHQEQIAKKFSVKDLFKK